MSNRLLSMKFMQRAEAAKPSNPPSPATPSSERPSKRQRLSTGGAASPATPNSGVQEYIAADELKRQQAIDRAGADAGETKWVLSVQHAQPQTVETPMRIVTAGYGAIDANTLGTTMDDDMSDSEQAAPVRPGFQGRRSFGKFNKTIERQTNPDMSSSEEEDEKDSEENSDSDAEDSDDSDDPAATMIKQQRKEAAEKIRKERKALRKSDQAELERLAKERRKKEVNLNRTGGGGISSGGRGIKNEVVCNKCGGKGHMMRDCPQGPQSHQLDVECFKCGKKGHLKMDCPQGSHQDDDKCYKCGEKGHLKMDCPNARQNSSQGQGQRGGANRPWKRRSGAEMDLDY